jgi:hypothetical protein
MARIIVSLFVRSLIRRCSIRLSSSSLQPLIREASTKSSDGSNSIVTSVSKKVEETPLLLDLVLDGWMPPALKVSIEKKLILDALELKQRRRGGINGSINAGGSVDAAATSLARRLVGSRFGALCNHVAQVLKPIYFNQLHNKSRGKNSPLQSSGALLSSKTTSVEGNVSTSRPSALFASSFQEYLLSSDDLSHSGVSLKAQLDQLVDILLDLRLSFLLLHEKKTISDRSIFFTNKASEDKAEEDEEEVPLLLPLKKASSSSSSSHSGGISSSSTFSSSSSTITNPKTNSRTLRVAASLSSYTPIHPVLRQNLSLTEEAWSTLEEEAQCVARTILLIRARALLARSQNLTEFAKRLQSNRLTDTSDPAGIYEVEPGFSTSSSSSSSSPTRQRQLELSPSSTSQKSSFLSSPAEALLPRFLTYYLGQARAFFDDSDLLSLDLAASSSSSSSSSITSSTRSRSANSRAVLKRALVTFSKDVEAMRTKMFAEVESALEAVNGQEVEISNTKTSSNSIKTSPTPLPKTSSSSLSSSDVLILQLIAAYLGDASLLSASTKVLMHKSAQSARLIAKGITTIAEKDILTSTSTRVTSDSDHDVTNEKDVVREASSTMNGKNQEEGSSTSSNIHQLLRLKLQQLAGTGSLSSSASTLNDIPSVDAPVVYHAGSWTAILEAAGVHPDVVSRLASPGVLKAINSSLYINNDATTLSTMTTSKKTKKTKLTSKAAIAEMEYNRAIIDVSAFRSALHEASKLLSSSSTSTKSGQLSEKSTEVEEKIKNSEEENTINVAVDESLKAGKSTARRGGGGGASSLTIKTELVPFKEAVSSIRALPVLSVWESKGFAAMWRVIRGIVKTPEHAKCVLIVSECTGLIHEGYSLDTVLKNVDGSGPRELMLQRTSSHSAFYTPNSGTGTNSASTVHDSNSKASFSSSSSTLSNLPIHRAASPLADPRFNVLLDLILSPLKEHQQHQQSSILSTSSSSSVSVSYPTAFYLLSQWMHLLRPSDVKERLAGLLAQLENSQVADVTATTTPKSTATTTDALVSAHATSNATDSTASDPSLEALKQALAPLEAACKLPRSLEAFGRNMPGVRGLVFSFTLRLCMLLSDAQFSNVRKTVTTACRVIESRNLLLKPGATPYSVRYPSGASFSAGGRLESDVIPPLWASVSHAHATFGPLAYMLSRPLVFLLVNGWLTPAFLTLARAVVVRGAVLSGAILREGEQGAISAFEHEADAALESKEMTSESIVEAELRRAWEMSVIERDQQGDREKGSLSLPIAQAAVEVVTERALAILRRRGETAPPPLSQNLSTSTSSSSSSSFYSNSPTTSSSPSSSTTTLRSDNVNVTHDKENKNRAELLRASLHPKIAEIARLIDARSIQLARAELDRGLFSSSSSTSSPSSSTSIINDTDGSGGEGLESIIKVDPSLLNSTSSQSSTSIQNLSSSSSLLSSKTKPSTSRMSENHASLILDAAVDEGREPIEGGDGNIRSTIYQHAAAPIHFTVRRVKPRVVSASNQAWELRNDEESIANKVCVIGLPILGQRRGAGKLKTKDGSPPSAENNNNDDDVRDASDNLKTSNSLLNATASDATSSSSTPPSENVTESLRRFLQNIGECEPFTESNLRDAAKLIGTVEHVELCLPPSQLYESEFWATERAQFTKWLWYKGKKQLQLQQQQLETNAKIGGKKGKKSSNKNGEEATSGVQSKALSSIDSVLEKAAGGEEQEEEIEVEVDPEEFAYAATEELAGGAFSMDEDDDDDEFNESNNELEWSAIDGEGEEEEQGSVSSMIPNAGGSSPRSGSFSSQVSARFFSTSSSSSSSSSSLSPVKEKELSNTVKNAQNGADEDSPFNEDSIYNINDDNEDDDDLDDSNTISGDQSNKIAGVKEKFPPRSRASSFPSSNNLRSLVAMRFSDKPLLQQLVRRIRRFNAESQLFGFIYFADRASYNSAVSSHLRYFGLVVDNYACPIVPASEMRTLLIRRAPSGLTIDACAMLLNTVGLSEHGLEASASVMRYRHNVVTDAGGHILLTFESHAEAVRGMNILQGQRWRDYGNSRGLGLVVGWASPEAFAKYSKAAQYPYQQR